MELGAGRGSKQLGEDNEQAKAAGKWAHYLFDLPIA